jgi:hypothetical protein
MQFRNRFRYIPLLAAGVLVFLGIVFAGDLSGLLWHIRTFDWWIPLAPIIVSRTVDWFTWGVSFLLSVSPAVLGLFDRRTKPDPVVILTSFIFPLFSLLTMSWSYYIGATLLVGSGFLIAYTLVSRSELILSIPRGSALRLIATEVFAFLAIAAAGGVVSILLRHEGALVSLVYGYDLNDAWLRMLILDVEAFYLTRPLLSAAFIILAVAAIFALFREAFQSFTAPLVKRLMKREHSAASDISAGLEPRFRRSIIVHRCLPCVILIASVLLGIAMTTYPYTVAKVGSVVGSDSWWYLQELSLMHTFADIPPRLQADRGFFLLLLFIIKTLTGLDPESLVEWMPALLSALLAVSSFVFVKEGTVRSWVAALASLLSVVSAQTSLGMGAFILTNWFALSIANFMLALVVRSIRRRSTLSAVGALVVSLVLLASYAFLWVVTIAELALVLLASILAFRNVTRREWKREVESLGGVLVGSILTPIAFLFLVVTPLLGFRPQGLDVSAWLMMGWNYLGRGATLQVLGSAFTALEEAFDFAGNRADLPFLTLLSIVGLVDQGSQHRSFGRIVSAMILVSAITTMITPSLYLTWRGLYIMPMYVTGALGAESIIRRVNGQGSPWSPSRLAFAAAFTGYLFLSHLSYSLRAVELLILVAR